MNMNLRRGGFWIALVALTTLQSARGLAQFEMPLQAPWQQADIGDVGVAGSATQTRDGDLRINGAGSDIWGTADSFHFVYQSLDDGEIWANTPSQTGKNPFAKVGLMIRMSLDPGSPHVILDVKPDGGIEFMTRAMPGGDTAFIAGAVSNQSTHQLRLIRNSGVVTGVVCVFNNESGDRDCHAIGGVPFPTGMALAGAAVTSHDPSTLSLGNFPASAPIVWKVPLPWSAGDVGAVGLAGETFSEAGVFTVKGAGSDIWGTSDSFRRVSMSGDGEIIARVTSEQAANTFAKAGVLMSWTSPDTPSGAKVILDVRPNGVIEFMARPADGAPMAFVAGSASSFPVWLKMTRNGDQFTGFTSSDGHEWQVVGMTTVALPHDAGIVAGLAVTSHDTAALNTSTFDHLLVAGRIPTDADVGDVGIAGQFNARHNGDYTLQGGGADIWGAADAFHYEYQFLKDDGELVIEVKGLDDTASFAKAGVMIRESLDPSAAHVLLDVTPSGLIELLTRESSGAETQWIGGASPAPFPVWLKLARSGTRMTALASSDGSTWQDVGTAFNTQLPPDALIGVAVTSHHRRVVTTATLSKVSP